MCKIILVMTLNRVEWPPLNTLCIRYAELSFSLRSQYLLLLGSCGMSLDEHGHTGKGPRRSQSINKVSLSEDTSLVAITLSMTTHYLMNEEGPIRCQI